VAYTQIFTISTDNILKTNEFRDSVSAQWTFLSDAGREIQKDLDIAEYTDPYYDPMIPYALVLKPGLVIYSVYKGRAPCTVTTERVTYQRCSDPLSLWDQGTGQGVPRARPVARSTTVDARDQPRWHGQMPPTGGVSGRRCTWAHLERRYQ
jgi:hypothetical protein